MATSASTLIQRTRRFLGDWPEGDSLTAAVSSTTVATLTIADASIYSPGWVIQIDQEAMRVKGTLPLSGTTLSVLRGAYGTTAATHSSAATILLRPAFLDQQILDALNAALDACFPLLYRPVATEYTGDTSTDYEYDVPNMATLAKPIPYLSKIQYKAQGDLAFRPINDWSIIRGDTPTIRFRSTLYGGGTLRFIGYGPYAHLTSAASTLDSFFPENAEDLLTEYAAQRLLMQGEAQRVRQDTGARDDRESANRTGSAMSAANATFQRFQMRLRDAAMPPMPRHVVNVYY